MPATTIKKPSKTVLKKALTLLQKSHNAIEINGFDMGSYYTSNGGAGCFIGNVRTAAGIDPEPEGGLDRYKPADKGDGPELTIALEYLDRAAMKTKVGIEYKENMENYSTGRLVEKIGMVGKFDKRYGLRVFRSAIRSIIKDIEG
jgi:hypothetical protein